MKTIRELKHELFNDEVDIRVRLTRVILSCVIIASVLGLLPMAISHAAGWWLNVVLCVISIFCQVLNVRFHKTQAAAFIMIFICAVVVLPSMYFRQGGIFSGVPCWMIFATCVSFIMLEGKLRYFTMLLSVIVYSFCFGAEFHFPSWVVPIATKKAIFLDIFISFVSSTIIYLIILDVHLRAYSKQREKLSYALQYDALTGVENRYAYEKYIHEINDKGLDDNLVVVSADVNELKHVNDNLGHSSGDELLNGAARVFTQSFAPYGKVFRVGGDEFQAILKTDKDLSQINSEFEENMKNWYGTTVKELHISVGYACNRDCKASNCTVLTGLADKEMYKNKSDYYKKSGKNRRIN